MPVSQKLYLHLPKRPAHPIAGHKARAWYIYILKVQLELRVLLSKTCKYFRVVGYFRYGKIPTALNFDS
ncbi:hypothetical protein [Aerosakkonema funiforme]|uniref:hypothetical protein n=1 Tax=Aerosakkonema funiforme TaxID=1246630 RepID=UPI00168BA044|nr:hypothetical protein [Aerosakkonema funiforme]